MSASRHTRQTSTLELPRTDSPRERILETASRLFSCDGYRAVGVDTIIAESGVAKMTLYKYFPSKDDLIAAFLERANRAFWVWFEGLMADIESPKGQLEAAFDGVAKLASSPACAGCSFMHAAAEFPDSDHPGHAVALTHKRSVLERFRDLAVRAGARDPDGMAQDLSFVLDGAWAVARMFGPGNHAGRVAQTARALIAAHLDGVPSKKKPA
jgi:AcrR family transcriptional regulator